MGAAEELFVCTNLKGVQKYNTSHIWAFPVTPHVAEVYVESLI